MASFVEIGGLIKKGLSHSIVEKFSKNKDVISVDMQMEEPQIFLISNSLVMQVNLRFLL